MLHLSNGDRLRSWRIRTLVVIAAFGTTVPAFAQPSSAPSSCKFLCQPTLLLEPTITIENLGGAPRATIFEAVVALDVPTSVPRLSFTFEAIVHPFVRADENPFTGQTASDLGGDVRENPVEIESEINFHWLESEQTGGWLSSHFDVVDQFGPAARPGDRSFYTHKLDFELDTAFAVFKNLPEKNWLRNIEVELSLDYLATGRPKKDGASPWSLSFVFVVPIIRGQ